MYQRIISQIVKVFLVALIVSGFWGMYVLGNLQGYTEGREEAQQEYLSYVTRRAVSRPTETLRITATPTATLAPTQNESRREVNWGGPELWEAVNKRRSELGVNSLGTRDELCTIASIRLNELLDLGTLDAHKGFSEMEDKRPDLKWIFEKYSVVAEFLALGGDTPEETVGLWENTLGHRKLLTGGEYVWGCIYAQNTFSVAIVAY